MAEMDSPLLDAELPLSYGRALEYAIWGDPEGNPVLLLHGSPSSRLFAPDPVSTATCGVRLVTVERPGYGRSDSLDEREILDWPADVTQLVDALGLQRFAVTAHSSGGPYALACALAMPERVTAVVLASSVVPLDELTPDVAGLSDEEQDLVEVARTDPLSAAAMIADAAGWLLEEPDRFLSLPRPEPDARLLENPPVREMFAASVREAVRRGSTGTSQMRCWSEDPGVINSRTSPSQCLSGTAHRMATSHRHTPKPWRACCPAVGSGSIPIKATACS